MTIENYWDVYTRKSVNSDGSLKTSKLTISYDELPTVNVLFGDSSTGTFTVLNVSSAVSWSAAINVDFNDSANVMARTLNASIDSSGASTGSIKVPVDSKTAAWLTELGTTKEKNAYLEIVGRDGSAKGIYKALIEIISQNAIDPSGGTAPATPGNYYTKSEMDAFLAALEAYTDTFTYSDIVGGNLVATHAKNTLYPFVVMQDSSGVVITPPWTVTDANTVTVDMSAWGVFAGTYKISIRK